MKTMKQILRFIFILFLPLGCNYAQQSQTTKTEKSKAVSGENDAAEIEKLFEEFKNQDSKLKAEKLISSKDDRISQDYDQIIWGDINADGTPDALLSFWVGNPDLGTLTEAYYAVFVSQKGKLTYVYSFYRGAASTYLDWPIPSFEKIEDGKIYGRETNNSDVYAQFPFWIYQYQKDGIKLIQEPLHPVLAGDYELSFKEYIEPLSVQMPDDKVLEIELPLKKLKAYFGKELQILAYSEELCDGEFRLEYRDDYEGEIFYGKLPFAQFEINDKNQAAWSFIDFTKTAAVLNTSQGQIDKSTTLNDFKRAFPKSCKSDFVYQSDGLMIIPFSASEDEEILNDIREVVWEVAFDKNGKIRWIQYWGAC